MKSFYEMRPDEIIKAREKSGLAFIPVSPLEWHGPHLPYGTDAIISEGICSITAEKVKGIYFSAMNYGLDAYRTEEQLSMWGFRSDDRIFGMNFPDLPLVSEYSNKEDLRINIMRRLQFLKDCRFKAAFVVNHHGGENQIPLIKKTCDEFTDSDFTAEAVYSMDFCTIKTGLPKYVGTHAGIWETQLVMAFRPDLVDLSKIPEGEITVKDIGIAHNKPKIEEEFDPRNANMAAANKIKENIIENFTAYIDNKYL